MRKNGFSPRLNGEDLHHAVLAVEMKAEAPAVGKRQEERLVPGGRRATVLHAMAKGKAETMTASHENSLGIRQARFPT